MLIAGACWLYPFCTLFTYWKECLCSLPTQPTAKRCIPVSRHGLSWGDISLILPYLFLQRNHGRGMHFRNYVLLRCWEMCLHSSFFGSAERTVTFAVVTVPPAKGHVHAMNTLSMPFRRYCGQAEMLSCFSHGEDSLEKKWKFRVRAGPAWCGQEAGSGEKREQIFPAYWIFASVPGHSLHAALLQERESFCFFTNVLWAVWELLPDKACIVDSTVQTKVNCCWKMREERKK